MDTGGTVLSDSAVVASRPEHPRAVLSRRMVLPGDGGGRSRAGARRAQRRRLFHGPRAAGPGRRAGSRCTRSAGRDLLPVIRTANSVAEVVESGLCIGCGLCEGVTNGRVRMTMTSAGSLRPEPADGFTVDEERKILSACPGVVSEPRVEKGLEIDPVWGAFSTMRHAWAGDPEIRFRAATGGVLTALGAHLLRRGDVEFRSSRRRRSQKADAEFVGS